MEINLPADMVEGSQCLEYGVPWIVGEAVYRLDDLLNRQDKVLEIGSGGSTVFFSDRCDSVFFIETSPEWFNTVNNRVAGRKNVFSRLISEEEGIVKQVQDISENATVFSVDTQGGYNRSKILNAFLEKGVSPHLRLIILDNYSHPELFPDHYDKDNFMGEDWEVEVYNHDRWAGSGTKLLIRKQQ